MSYLTYTKQPSLIFAFHGCKKSLIKKIILSDKKHLNKSSKDYDWLGHGIYFWQNDPQRALEWAQAKFWGR